MEDQILIAEDSETTGYLIENILKKKGYGVFRAKNGIDALNITDQIIPDLILLDILMPELNGLQTAQKLQEKATTKEIPIVFLSSLTDEKYIKRGFSLGGVDYIRKPFKIEELLARIESHLKLSKLTKELKNLFNINQDLLCIADAKGEIIKINRATENLFHKSPDQITGKNLLEFVHFDDKDSTKRFLAQLKNKQNKQSFINRVQCHDNCYRHLEWQCVQDNKLVYLFARDITSLFNKEKRLIQKKSEMERLLCKVSHDLRLLLINIKGFTQNLEEKCNNLKKHLVNGTSDCHLARENVGDEFSEDTLESFRFIYKYIEKMDDLLYQFDFLSDITPTHSNLGNVDVYYIVHDILKKNEEKIQLYKVNIVIENLEKCFADEYLLYKVFSYIIDNTLVFGDPEKKNTITISSKNIDAKIVYSIKDNGLGIDEKDIDKVFEMLYSTDEKRGKRGLGLPMAERILRMIYGKIWIESVKGIGTSVYISLPSAKNDF